MNYEPGKRNFGWMSRGAIALFAVLYLPMAMSVAEPDPAADTTDIAAAENPSTPYPQIISTVPEIGETGVDPKIEAISVAFDRPMSEGMSWTGGPPEFPPTDKNNRAFWKDDRTCVLPVKLEEGKLYRVGFNSKSYQNFRSATGQPTPPRVLLFTTQGASKAIERRIRAPKIVKIVPENGGTKVDPTIKALRVTFDSPMGKGMSWTGSGETFPETPDPESLEGKRARWSSNGKTCSLPVTLKPNHSYRLGFNSRSHNNFQSKWGVPLVPVVYEFTTGEARNP